MSRTNYQIVFRVTALHTYFKQNKCTCLDFTPTKSTSGLLQQFGLKIRPQQSGFELYANTRDSIDSYLKYIATATNESSFDFNISTKISNFNIITDIPTNWVGTIQFDSGSASNSVEGNVVEMTAGYTTADEPLTLAQLKINFQDIYRYQQEQSDPEFEIVFKARSTQWNYYVVNKNSHELDKPRITGKSDIEFNGPFNRTIQTGEEALLFTSGDHLIPLSEVPKYKFNLLNERKTSNPAAKSHFTSKTIYKGLPNPDPGKIGIEEEEGKNIVSSPMYVYV